MVITFYYYFCKCNSAPTFFAKSKMMIFLILQLSLFSPNMEPIMVHGQTFCIITRAPLLRVYPQGRVRQRWRLNPHTRHHYTSTVAKYAKKDNCSPRVCIIPIKRNKDAEENKLFISMLSPHSMVPESGTGVNSDTNNVKKNQTNVKLNTNKRKYVTYILKGPKNSIQQLNRD